MHCYSQQQVVVHIPPAGGPIRKFQILCCELDAGLPAVGVGDFVFLRSRFYLSAIGDQLTVATRYDINLQVYAVF